MEKGWACGMHRRKQKKHIAFLGGKPEGHRSLEKKLSVDGKIVLKSILTLLWYHGVYVTPVLFDSRFFFLKLSRILTSPFTYFCARPS